MPDTCARECVSSTAVLTVRGSLTLLYEQTWTHGGGVLPRRMQLTANLIRPNSTSPLEREGDGRHSRDITPHFGEEEVICSGRITSNCVGTGFSGSNPSSRYGCLWAIATMAMGLTQPSSS